VVVKILESFFHLAALAKYNLLVDIVSGWKINLNKKKGLFESMMLDVNNEILTFPSTMA
jgi:hypothetical protein